MSEPYGERWPLIRLAELCGLAPSTLRDVLVARGLDGSEGFDVCRAVPAVVAHYRECSERISAQGIEATTRKRIAEADIAELELEKMVGGLVSMDEARRIFEDVRIQTREVIRRHPSLTWEEKVALCDKLATIVPREAGA